MPLTYYHLDFPTNRPPMYTLFITQYIIPVSNDCKQNGTFYSPYYWLLNWILHHCLVDWGSPVTWRLVKIGAQWYAGDFASDINAKSSASTFDGVSTSTLPVASGDHSLGSPEIPEWRHHVDKTKKYFFLILCHVFPPSMSLFVIQHL